MAKLSRIDVNNMEILIGQDGLAVIAIRDGRNWFEWGEWLIEPNDEDGA